MITILKLFFIIYFLTNYEMLKESIGEFLKDLVYVIAFICSIPVRIYLYIRQLWIQKK